jgi:hypothetical protein
MVPLASLHIFTSLILAVNLGKIDTNCIKWKKKCFVIFVWLIYYFILEALPHPPNKISLLHMYMYINIWCKKKGGVTLTTLLCQIFTVLAHRSTKMKLCDSRKNFIPNLSPSKTNRWYAFSHFGLDVTKW